MLYEVALKQTCGHLSQFCINTLQRLAYLRLVRLAVGNEVLVNNGDDLSTDVFKLLLDLSPVLPDKLKLFRLQFLRH